MKFFEQLFNNVEIKDVSGLTDELKCIYIYQLYKKFDRSILVVCNSIYEANKFYQSISNYCDDALFFPMDDFLTSEILAVSPDFKMTRLETLNDTKSKKNIVTNLMGYLRFLPKKELFFNSYINLCINDEYDIKELENKLYNIGYDKEAVVDKTGTMACRGYVLDVFPINFENPIRIEFWGNQIESIRMFDIDSQLKLGNLESIKIIPNSEYIINGEVLENYKHRDIVKYGEVSNIKDYLDNSILVYNDFNDLKNSYINLQNDIVEYCESSNIDMSTLFMHDFLSLDNGEKINLCNFDTYLVSTNYSAYKIEEKFVFENLSDQLDYYLNKYEYVIIGVSNRYQANKIIDNVKVPVIFTNLDELFKDKINIVVFNFNEGFIFNNIVVIGESEIFNKSSNLTYKTNFKYGTRIKNINKLEIGDYVVHNTHGIGRYCGIKTICKNNLNKDYLTVEYKGGDKLYIPVEKIDLITKYSSKEGFEPKVNKLGSTEWEKVKLRAKKRAKDIAEGLLKLYALREMQEGFAFCKDSEEQAIFESEFPYEETKDQIKVLEEIKNDMESNHPMDRLLCGDVGYGKTEVAFRAAFKAILSGKQVALLCPTTILSSQHYQNAIDRFKSFPVNIALLNRFTTPKQVSNIINGLKEGKVDFVIGTHKLFNDEINYKNLGLLIIDEEQRFGVTHKEKIKKIKSNVDVLTLSATPIPRTLQMSLSGIRQLSIIETPPGNRYPVQTYVLSYNKKVIKDAIYKELSRNGQVFLLYNHIDDIESKVRELQDLVKDAKISFAHGRMGKQELEDIMFKFINKEFDVLVCTTIIETGIDIPNANTLIIVDADRFGLAQLYQLRGRVGRANKVAYCYLMYDDSKILNPIAKKRLSAIKEFTELGSGLSIAMRDLSIRGAGDVLGSEQAGFVDSVGIELFMKMLKQEIDKIKGVYVAEEEDSQPLIEVDTAIKDTYVKEEDLKIEIHKKINQINTKEKLLEVKNELEDRFGKLDEDMIIYMYEEWFENLAVSLNINKIKQGKDFVEVTLNKDMTNKINGEFLFLEALKITSNFKFKMFAGNLIISLNIKNLDKHFIYYLIDLLFIIEKAI